MAKAKAKAAPKQLASTTHELMAATWSKWGKLAPQVITHAINPMFMGGPRWPGLRQAYRVARAGKATLIASDGLADPYDRRAGPVDVNGLGLELFAVTDDKVARAGAPVTAYAATWLYQLVSESARLAARHGGVAGLIDKYGAIVAELHDIDLPATRTKRFVNEHGRVGVLLAPGCGTIPKRVAGPLGPIRLVHVLLLTLEELAFAVDGGERAPRKLGGTIGDAISRLDRRSAV